MGPAVGCAPPAGDHSLGTLDVGSEDGERLGSGPSASLVGTREGAKIDSTKAMLASIETAIDTYNMHIGHYPTEEEGNLTALRVKPTFESEQVGQMWRGPYLKKEPRDAWRNTFNYEVNVAGTDEAQTQPYRLWSNGPDGVDGTEDDVKNWSEEDAGP